MLRIPHRHVIAWTALSVGNDVLSTTGLALYSSATLQALGQGVGFWGGNLAYPCSMIPPHAGAVCKAHVLGRWLDVSSLALLIKSAGIFLQVVLVPTFAPLADDHRKRLPLVIASSLLSAVGAAAYFLFPVQPTHAALVLSAALLVILNCTLGLLAVCVNAFLRTIAREQVIRSHAAVLDARTTAPPATDGRTARSPDDALVRRLEARGVPADDTALERLPLLGTTRTENKQHASPEGKALARMSGVGHGLATLSTVGVTQLGGYYLRRHPTGLLALYQVQGTIGVVVGVTSMIAVYFLPRASDPLQDNASAGSVGAQMDVIPHWTDGWRRIGSVLRWSVIRALPSLFVFLALFSLLADVMHTAPATLMAYMQGRLGAGPGVISEVAIYPLGIGGLTALAAPVLQSQVGISSKALLLVGGGVLALDLMYGTLPLWMSHAGAGYTSIRGLKPVLGLQGLAYGLIPAYGRTLFAQMIPVGYESAFFSLFALGDRTCSFTGPLLVAAIANLTGGFEWVWFALGIMALVPVAVIAFGFSPAKGEEEGRRWRTENRSSEA